jgi:hypothetical protein
VPRRVEAVQSRHGDIENDDVGSEPGRLVEELVAVRRGADDFIVFREDARECVREQAVIVGEDKPRPRFFCACHRGRLAGAWARRAATRTRERYRCSHF